jgi:hypothetical protein
MRGGPEPDADELRKIIEGVDDPAVRTAVRFAIADIYKETGQRDRALDELRLVVAENKALLARKRSGPAPEVLATPLPRPGR